MMETGSHIDGLTIPQEVIETAKLAAHSIPQERVSGCA